MKDHALLLSTPMVCATLAGLKSVTRRIPGPTNSYVDGKRVSGKKWKELAFDWSTYYINECGVIRVTDSGNRWHSIIPIYEAGDTIWFRETWCAEQLPQPPEGDWDKTIYRYKASEEFDPATLWRPSIHMPKEACRLFANVQSCRCEHLQDITEEQAIREGVSRGILRPGPNVEKGEIQLELNNHASYLDGFKFVWHQLHGPDSWPANPPVYAIEFKLLSSTGRPDNPEPEVLKLDEHNL